MDPETNPETTKEPTPLPGAETKPERSAFKAEIQQVLDILIHSLYTEREIFLRELISNASDALHRFKLEALTQEVLDPAAELAIWIEADQEARRLTIRDSGLGMSQAEMVQNLGTIAHSGAKSFLEALKERGEASGAREVIGQFGVGFYAVFMVADKVTVRSRSYQPGAQGAYWASEGQGSFEVGPTDARARGTIIEIALKEDAAEFADNARLRRIVKTHSDFVSFPIYLKEGASWQQVNQRTAIWRGAAKEVSAEQQRAFYKQRTFDPADPLVTVHLSADAPIQFHALLFVPSRRDYKLVRDEHGLALYARSVLIKDHFKELLPPYLRFIEGVVDSEDLPLNVSREMVQASPAVRKIRAALIGRLQSEFKKLAENAEAYQTFYREFGSFLKEGVASAGEGAERFVELLRFASSLGSGPGDWVSLHSYAARMKPEQRAIYYLLADSYELASNSAHLEPFRARGLEVLFFTEPVDAFMLMGLRDFEGKPLRDIGAEGLELPALEQTGAERQDRQEGAEGVPYERFKELVAKVKATLGDRALDVRESKVLTSGAARLVSPAGAASSLQRVQRMMGEETTPQKILELNRNSELVAGLAARFAADPNDPLLTALIEQLFDNELLMEGLHPNPAAMIPRIQQLMAEATRKP